MDNIFPYMKNVYFDDYMEFVRDVDSERKNFLNPNKNFLNLPVQEIDVDHISEIKSGRLHSVYKKYVFESFFYKKKSKYLYVILNGSLDKRKPEFHRWSYYKFLDGSLLNIADPMYEKYEALKLGWYYGNAEENLRKYLAEYVKKIADYLDIEGQNIIFWGSSGGGAAALETVNYIKGATAAAINPQILLKDYYYSAEFEKITGINLEEDKWNRADGISHLRGDGQHVLIINLRSEMDMLQVKKISEALNFQVKYGINVYDNLIIWIYDADLSPFKDAHSVQEFYCICFVMQWIGHHHAGKKKIEGMNSLFCLFNEFWYERYKSEAAWRSKRPNFPVIKECILNNRRIVVWGGGARGKFMLRHIFDADRSNYLKVQFVIDSDVSLKEKKLLGLDVITPDKIKNWNELFVIVAVQQKRDEILAFLEEKELQYKEDYLVYEDLIDNFSR